MYKIAVYQTAPVWFVKNECFMAKIDVYRSLLASDRVIGWDIKMTSHPNSNASFINIWDRLIWRRSPNLTRSSKLAAAPNWWLLNSKFTQHSLQGTRQKWTGLSHHAQLSMCTSRDKMAASGMEFSVLIECEFVAVVSWKVGWLCFFNTKFALVRSDDWWVSFTRPWAVFTRLGRPDEWLVRTLNEAPFCQYKRQCHSSSKLIN